MNTNELHETIKSLPEETISAHVLVLDGLVATFQPLCSIAALKALIEERKALLEYVVEDLRDRDEHSENKFYTLPKPARDAISCRLEDLR